MSMAMKTGKRLAAAGLVLAALAMAGCAAQMSPSQTVREFFRALQENDMAALAEVATPETAQMMAMFGAKIQGMIEGEGYAIMSMEEHVDGDFATVDVVFENGEEQAFSLVKADGRWKVSMDLSK